MQWDMLIGDTPVGRLSEEDSEDGVTICRFEPYDAFPEYAEAFRSGDISERNDDALDAVIDHIAVDGVFLVADDGTGIVDPDLRIDGTVARF